MQLHLSTWEEVERYLETSKGIIIPIGSTEQHGPNGLIGTDAICPEVIAKAVGDETGALVGPTISIGNAQHHLGFAGSVTVRPTTLIAIIEDYVASLARNGFERFYFLNGHGGNIATIGAAFAEIYADYSLAIPGSNRPQVRCTLKNWWDTPGVQALSKELYGDRDGSHATASEVSVTQFAYPDHIKHKEMKQAGRAPRAFADADDYRKLYPDGRIGSDPTMARPEHGERLVAASAREVAEDYKKFLAQA
ncbi:creatininase family protein [Oceanibaculum pacificum]|uniref:Amidase n=1 Tax=Oceanibaculum pacificum TaxID=580166 RepID=A0A154VRF1_9PROT|nr:creatininase family protein [Oceanibaculum pacificum]KZD03845.1 amidase [Oceanibaculum pacificum]